MIRHSFQVGAISAAALACMFYPFMPGRYDPLAVTLSMVVQALGFAGLLLVPIGASWLIHDLVKGGRTADSVGHRDKGHYFAVIALATSSLVGAAVALAGTLTAPSLGIAMIAVWTYVTWRSLQAVKRMRQRPEHADRARVNPAPLYLILIPGILVGARLMFLETAVESSRRRAIHGSAEFINAIERYRTAHGRYPVTLASVHHDYDPPVVGVERYHYEPQGEAYNVFFEQFTYPIGMQEFVMYNPLDQHMMIVHNQDLLESPREQVERERSFHARAAHDAGVPHWKYFWFD